MHTVALGADHAGFVLKEQLKAVLQAAGAAVTDVGTHAETPPVDYPDIAAAVADRLRSKAADRGILVCGSGVGAAIAANKIPGIRAGLCHDTYSARQGVEHDRMNVLCLGARVVGAALAGELVRAFLAAEWSGAERHRRRVEKITALEEACRTTGA